VVPERAHGFAHITVRRVRTGKAGQHVRIVVVVEARVGALGLHRVGKEIVGEAVAFGRRVAVVQVCDGLGNAKTPVVGRQLVAPAHQHVLAVLRVKGHAGDAAVKAPEPLVRQVGRDLHLDFADLLIEHLLRRKRKLARIPEECLVRPRAALATRVVGPDGGGRVEAIDAAGQRSLDRHDRQRVEKLPGLRTLDVLGVCHPTAQAVLENQHAGARQQPHLEQVAARRQAGGDQLLAVVPGIACQLAPLVSEDMHGKPLSP
jgi:hypothetical protein